MAADDQIEMKQQFANLANGVASGQLIIEDGTANRCIMICQDFLVDLKNFQRNCDRLTHVDSFGTLKSAQALGQSFETLAIGGTGSGSLHEALQERIDAVQAMEDMLTKARDAFIASDEATKDRIRQAMKNLDS